MDRITLSVTELKTKCMAVLDQLASREIDEVVVTKDGKAVGLMGPVMELDEQAQARSSAADRATGRHP